MSLECSHCERDLRAGHADNCDRPDVIAARNYPASKLVNGKIPARTECPYNGRCTDFAWGNCAHKGEKHTREFSCGTARALDLEYRHGLVRSNVELSGDPLAGRPA